MEKLVSKLPGLFRDWERKFVEALPAVPYEVKLKETKHVKIVMLRQVLL